MSPKPNLRVAGPPPELVAGGPVEFDALFARYGRYVAQLAARLLGSGDAEVDDVVQDVFWLASRRLPKIVDMIQGLTHFKTTMHFMGNQLIDFKGPNAAEVETYCIAYLAEEKDGKGSCRVRG